MFRYIKTLDAARNAVEAGTVDTLLVAEGERKRADEMFRGLQVLDAEELVQALILGRVGLT